MFKFQGYVRREKKEQVVKKKIFFFNTKLLTNLNTHQHGEQRK